MENSTDRARILVESACDEFLSGPNVARNMKVAEICNFFLYGEHNQIVMATGQLQAYFKLSNPAKVNDASGLISEFRFQELLDALLTKYGSCPEGWQEQCKIYKEVSRTIYYILQSTDLKVITLGISLLQTLAVEAHREGNRFLLEAITDERICKQIRVLWKAHKDKTGGYSMQITEEMLRWVQMWRDEMVPPSERKKFDPANTTKWGWGSLQASVKSYATMSSDQLAEAAQSGAHWLDKRVKEATGIPIKKGGLFAPLEECHHKLKKRGADFPDIDFSSNTRRSIDIQRCSSLEEHKLQSISDSHREQLSGGWDPFEVDQTSSISPSSVASYAPSGNTTLGGASAKSRAIQIRIKPASNREAESAPVTFNGILPPPYSSKTQQSAIGRGSEQQDDDPFALLAMRKAHFGP